MADAPRDQDELVDSPEEETRDQEQERVRSSNDEDQEMEREGVESTHNRGYDAAVRGQSQEDVDPDSAESEIDRDDTTVE